MSTARPAPKRYTQNQLLARKIAYGIFVRCRYGHWSVGRPLNLVTGVRREISDHATRHRSDIVKIANAYPELIVSLPAGHVPVRSWQRELAAHIMIHLIGEIVGTKPRYARRYPEPQWIWVGCAPRNIISRPLTPRESADPIRHALEDLYVSADGEEAVVVYGPYAQHVAWGHIDGQGLADASVREAFRRFELYDYWQRQQPVQMALPVST